MEKYEHGGHVDQNTIRYDFSANINPMGLPKGVCQVLTQNTDAFSNYPDPDCVLLRKVIAEHEHVGPAQVACGNGAVELIYKVLAVKQPKRVLIPAPAFVEYEKAVLECGGQVVYYDMPEPFVLTEGIIPVLAERDIDAVILCNPHNPTGDMIKPELLWQIIEVCIQYSIMLLLDACFLGFAREEPSQEKILKCGQVVIVKAFTKLYAMAGIRLGYMLCRDEALAEQIRCYGPCWSVSVPAQLAGVAALQETVYVEETKCLIERERGFLENALRSLGLRVYPSKANFILFYCRVPIMDGLKKAGIAIRCCENYRGLGRGYYRIAVRCHEDNMVLLETLREILR